MFNQTSSCPLVEVDSSQKGLHVKTKYNSPWVINSGISNHMTGNSGMCVSYSSSYKVLKIKMINGYLYNMVGKETIQLLI